MGKIYSGMEGLKVPTYPMFKDFDKYQKACNTYIDRVKAAAKRMNPTCPEAGEEITFPVADGRARYIVVSLKPVQLIHDGTMDSWHYQYVHRLNARDIRAEIKRAKALQELFNKKRTPK
jgi:hypothetical protein